MANTYVDYVGSDGTGTDGKEFAFSFPYIKTSHVVVEINQGPAGGTNKWERTTAFTVETSPSTRVVLDSTPNSLWKIRVLRDSDANTGIVDFANGSVLTETELDNAYNHNRYLAEEAEEGVSGGTLSKNEDGQFNADALRIENVADPDSDDDAVNKGYADTRFVNVTGDTMSGALTLPGTDPTDGNHAARKTYVDAQIATTLATGVAGGPIDTANIADDAVTAAKLDHTAVTPGSYTNTNLTVDQQGRITAASNGAAAGEENVQSDWNEVDTNSDAFILNKPTITSGTVTSVDSGTGLTGGPITTSGTLSLANTAVTAGSYTNTNLTVDAQGRITAASNGSSGSGTPNWTSGWFNNTTGLANGGTYSFTHSLGTTNLTATIWVADDANGTNAQEVRNYFHANASAEYGAVLTSISTTTTTLQLLQDGWIAINSSGVGPGLSTGGAESWSGHYVKVVLSASATVGAVSKYSTGWFNDSGTGLSNGSNYTFTHGLGSADLTFTAFASATGSDSDQVQVNMVEVIASLNTFGCGITALSTTGFTLQLASGGFNYLQSNGSHATGNWSSYYVKIVAVG